MAVGLGPGSKMCLTLGEMPFVDSGSTDGWEAHQMLPWKQEKQRDISTVLFPCFFHKHISNQRCFAPTHLRPRMLLQVFLTVVVFYNCE